MIVRFPLGELTRYDSSTKLRMNCRIYRYRAYCLDQAQFPISSRGEARLREVPKREKISWIDNVHRVANF